MDHMKKTADEFQVVVVYAPQPVNAYISSKPQELEGLNGFLPTQSVRQHPGLCLVSAEGGGEENTLSDK